MKKSELKTIIKEIILSEEIKKYYDANNKLLNIGDLVEVKYVTGRYGETSIVHGELTKIDQYSGITLDDEKYITGQFTYKDGKFIGTTKHDDYEHGHTTHIIKINSVNPKYKIVKKLMNITVFYVDYSNNKNRDKSYADEHKVIFETNATTKDAITQFEEFLHKNYPKCKSNNSIFKLCKKI
jgi:hypothetical protein